MVNEALQKLVKRKHQLKKTLAKKPITMKGPTPTFNPNAPKQKISVKPNIPAPAKLDPHKKPGMGLKPGPKLNAQQAQHLANTLKARKA